MHWNGCASPYVIPAKAGIQCRWIYSIGPHIAEAAKWFRKPADQGHAGAQFYLGLMYRDGQGVARNYALAYMWLSLAAAQNYEKARETLDDLEKKVTPQQRDEAQRMAREWKPIHK